MGERSVLKRHELLLKYNDVYVDSITKENVEILHSVKLKNGKGLSDNHKVSLFLPIRSLNSNVTLSLKHADLKQYRRAESKIES